MHSYLSCVFLFRKVLRPLLATIRHYSLFATIRTIRYSRLFAIRYSGFPDTPMLKCFDPRNMAARSPCNASGEDDHGGGDPQQILRSCAESLLTAVARLEGTDPPRHQLLVRLRPVLRPRPSRSTKDYFPGYPTDANRLI